MSDESRARAELMLRSLAGPDAVFRDGQWEAIAALLEGRRALVVQRTGWGKSGVYLIATRLLRDAGAGPTVIVSPLLVLMRNQIEMADRAGVAAATINSANRDDWAETEAAVARGEIDLLLVSPERLANERFQIEVLPDLIRTMGMLVVDEAHCISDWGHDFRPDYRRLARLVAELPHDLPVLATTATANDRVVSDVASQLGENLEVIRGTLDRQSLGLQVVVLPDAADRLAWLATTIPQLSGSGIVYSLTVRDAERVGEFLRSRGINAATYTGPMTPEARLEVEEALQDGEIDVVSATSALGMGYDNPFIEFVIHYQSPGSPVAYYQQVGRAGRAVEQSVGVLLSGAEDVDIQDWFIETAFPPEPQTRAILDAIDEQPLSVPKLEQVVNLSRGRIQSTLKQLEIEGAVGKDGSTWNRVDVTWEYPHERIDAVTAVRRSEQQLMLRYLNGTECLMAVLRRSLDDEMAEPCGRCAVCRGEPIVPVDIDAEMRSKALQFLNRSWIEIQPRLTAPAGLGIPSPKKHRCETGRAMSSWADPGVGVAVQMGKFRDRRFGDELVDAADVMLQTWRPEPAPTWVAWIPNNGADLIGDFANRLGERLGLPAVPAVRRISDRPKQATMENSFRQASNQAGAFEVSGAPPGPALLIDDTVDSRWSLTVVGAHLRAAGVEAVHPLVLADTSRAPG